MYDQHCNTMPYRFGVKLVWFNGTQKQINFHNRQDAQNKFEQVDYPYYQSVSLVDKQHKIEIKVVETGNIEIYMNGNLAGEIAETYDDEEPMSIYAFTAFAYSPSGNRSINRDFIVDGQPFIPIRWSAIDWVQTQHCNLALGAL